MSLVYQVFRKNTMKNLKLLIILLLVLHAVVSVVKGFDLLSTVDVMITVLLAFLVAKMDKESKDD